MKYTIKPNEYKCESGIIGLWKAIGTLEIIGGIIAALIGAFDSNVGLAIIGLITALVMAAISFGIAEVVGYIEKTANQSYTVEIDEKVKNDNRELDIKPEDLPEL